MEHKTCHLNDIGHDLLGNIVSRLEGPALASVSCTCSDLPYFAQDQTLWMHLCHPKWPSTQLEEAHHLISSSVAGGFAEFFANSYKLIAYHKSATEPPETTQLVDIHNISPSDLVLLVDVHLDNKCVVSGILDGIPQALDIFQDNKLKDIDFDALDDQRQRWFLSCPFRLDILDQDFTDKANHDLVNAGSDNLPCQDRSKELTASLRLSWILFDKKSGKAVNLSSWTPMSVHRVWPYQGDYVVQFGSIVRVGESVLPHNLAKCRITTRFKMAGNGMEEPLQWREISLGIEIIEGTQTNGEKSLKILKQALCSSRTTNQHKVGFPKRKKYSGKGSSQKN